ncbi:hypothetical protein [Moorena sp. SIO4G3]|uniref:hypothetical protein n=1 Tax=Moorena sp. SIO4G3 TaxID=2607821 RepID=UPI00142BF798|nr:hypothetical protein [Moorena sp. SIO4G3]NEO77179.1 hypothetical protein [Moorena sp. SIO4G3]
MLSALIQTGEVKQDPLDSRSSHGSANIPKANSVGCSVGCHFVRINIHGQKATLSEQLYKPLIQAALALTVR